MYPTTASVKPPPVAGRNHEPFHSQNSISGGGGTVFIDSTGTKTYVRKPESFTVKTPSVKVSKPVSVKVATKHSSANEAKYASVKEAEYASAKKKRKDEDAASSPGHSKKRKVIRQPMAKLTAYNFFFREERDRMLQDIDESEPYDTSEAKKQALLGQHWRQGRSRKHRRTHGKLNFDSLSSTIGRRWKNLPDHVRAFYKELGVIDAKRFKKENLVFQAFVRSMVEQANASASDDDSTAS